MKFADHGLISLRPDTCFRIDEFELAVRRGRSFFSLAKAGFRAVSGRIGKSRPEDFRISTPVVTLGIRGTDFGATLCATVCAVGSKGLLPGLYVRLNRGVIVVHQAARELFAKAGQAIYIKDSTTLPVPLSEPRPESFWSLGSKTASAAALPVSVPVVAGGGALIASPFAVILGKK